MATSFKKAGPEVYELMEELINENHEHLDESNIEIYLRAGKWETKGRTKYETAKIMAKDMRVHSKTDAVLILNGQQWEEVLNEQQKRCVLDTALERLDIQTNISDETKYDDDDGRPKLATKKYDFEGFMAVIRRHGLVMPEQRRAVKAMTEAKQMTLEEVLRPDEEAVQALEAQISESDEQALEVALTQ